MADNLTFGPPIGDVLIDSVVAPPPAEGKFTAGVKSGVAGLKSGLYGFGALAAHGVKAAAEDLGATKLAGAYGQVEQAAVQNQAEQAVLAAPAGSPTWAGVTDVSSGLDWAKYTAGSFVPTIATMAVGGGAVGLGAKALGVASEAAPGVLALAKNIGAMASVTPSAIGDVYARAKETGVDDPELRAIAGGVGSVLPYALPLGALHKYGAKAGGGSLMGAAKGAAVGAPLVGVEEVAAQAVMRGAAGQPLTGPEASQEYSETLAAALLFGGLGGAAVGAHRGMRPAATPPEPKPAGEPIAPTEAKSALGLPNIAGEPMVVFPDGSAMTRAEYNQRQQDGIMGSGKVEPAPAAEPVAEAKAAEPAAPATPEEMVASLSPEQIVAAYSELTQKVAELTPALEQAKQAQVDLVARRDALTAEAKMAPGERRTKSEIAKEKAAIQAQIKEAKAQIEAVGGQLHETKTSVDWLAPYAEKATKAPEPAPAEVTPAMQEELVARGHEPADIVTMEPAQAVEAIRTTPTIEDVASQARVAAGGAPVAKVPAAAPVPAASERAYTETQANAYAKRMTAQGLPSEVVPHPTEAGKFAIRAPGEGKETTATLPSEPAKVTELPSDLQQLHDHIAEVIAAKKNLSAAKKAEHADAVGQAIDSITTEARTTPENYRAVFIKEEVAKRIGMRLPADVKADIVDHITREANTQYSRGATYESIMVKQRAFEGFTAAVRDPETGEIYTGPSHRQAIAFAPADPALRARLARAVDQDASMKNVGFLDQNGKFITRDRAERIMYSKGRSNAALTQDTFDRLPEQAKVAAVTAFNDVMREKGRALTARLTELIGERAGVEVKTFSAESGAPIGSYTRADAHKAVISMALNAKDGLSVADHEGYHYAEDNLLTSAERQIITNGLKEGKVVRAQLMERLQQYDRENKTNLTDEVSGSPAEARAYAFEFWRRGELKTEGALARVFEKLRQFFEKISNAVKGLGFKSMEDIFTALDRGQFAEREASVTSKRPASEEGGVAPLLSTPELRELYSKAAVKAEREMTVREEDGDLQRQQVQDSFLRMVDDAKAPELSLKFASGLAKDVIGGSLKRWWYANIATPNYISKDSAAYRNVQQTLNTFIRYRKILAEQMLREKLPAWYKASDVNRKAAFSLMLERTVEGYTKDSIELRTKLAALEPQQRELFDQATGMIEGFLRAQFEKDQISRKTQLTSEGAYEKWLEARKAQVEDMIDKGYVPLRRYGDYSVRVFTTTADGKRVDGGLMFFDSEARARVAAKMYQDEITRSGADLQVEMGIRSKNIRDTGISIEQVLGTLQRNGVELSQAERERLVLTLTNSESMVRNKMMRREGLPGYSDDSMRVLHEFGVNMSGELAYARFATAIDAAVAGGEVKADVDSTNSEPMIQVGDTFGKREDGLPLNMWEREGPMSGFYRNLSDELANYVLVPDHSGAWSRRLRAAAMVYFIGGSISGAAVNAMSVPMLTVPELSIHTDYGNALGRTMTAWKDAWRHYGTLRDIDKMKDPTVSIPGISPELRQAIVAAADHIFDTEIHQMLGMSQGTVYSKSRNVQRAMEAYMSPFRVSEQTNRLASFISAYRIASEDGVKQADGSTRKLTGQELFKFASDIVDATQNNYNESNRPGAARNPVYALMFMFKSFPLFMVEAAALMYKQSPRAAVNMLLGLTAMAGVQGLPFAQTIEDLIDTIAQNIFGSPFNSRRAMRNVIKSASEAMVGADLSDLVLNGMVNDVVGVSVSSRIGMGDFVPGSRLGTADADQGKILSQIAGAPYSMVHDVVTNIGGAVSGLATGDWKQAADALRAGGPVALRNVVKGVEQLDRGYASDAKGRRIVDTTTLDGVLQMTGLSSAALAKAYDLERINVQTKAFYTQISQDMQAQLIAAIRDNDIDKVQEINDLRNAWNKRYPEMPIMPSAAAVRRGVMLAGMPLDRRSQMQWARQIRGNNVFSEQPTE